MVVGSSKTRLLFLLLVTTTVISIWYLLGNEILGASSRHSFSADFEGPQSTKTTSNIEQLAVYLPYHYNDTSFLKHQNCIVPKLNPYYYKAMHYSYDWKEKCNIKRYGKIRDGRLHLKMKNVQRAGYYYIRWHTDYTFKLSEWIPLLEQSDGEDIDIVEELHEDYIQLFITHNNQHHVEFHMHVVWNVGEKKTEKKTMLRRSDNNNENQFNVLMLMIDTFSHVNAIRTLKNTYKHLQNDLYTTIFNAHTVIGDGTTAQLNGIFLGQHQNELPEARKGFSNSNTVDSWPFIFKDFERVGYKTIFSEDQTSVGAWQYRLKGFKDQPTTKYLRTWWLATRHIISKANAHSRSCSHEFAFDYIKQLFESSDLSKKFAVFMFSSLTHDDPSKAKLIDSDLLETINHLKRHHVLNNTIVILFGDHGPRHSHYRNTDYGKLEQRLPFLSMTVPSWFQGKYALEFENLKRNRHVFTSHYDIHATLKHLLHFPKVLNFNDATPSQSPGRSLFSNLYALNRRCNDAGVSTHWCPCFHAKTVDITDVKVRKASLAAVWYINNKILRSHPVARDRCHHIELMSILKASSNETDRSMPCDQKKTNDSDCIILYSVMFTVTPNNQEFEASVYYYRRMKTFIIDSNIERVNSYGNEPKCIAKEYPSLRKYCYCKDHQTQSKTKGS